MLSLLDFFELFFTIAGLIIGLGAVTVIDLHGFLARKNSYWTESTIRAHKVTKPLIWLGIFLYVIGLLFTYQSNSLDSIIIIQFVIALALVLNGLFLSFSISPKLLAREQAGKIAEILPAAIQNKIFVSFIFSFAGWWGSVCLAVITILQNRL